MKQTGNSGFTLAELLVASTISGFIALVAVGALNAVSHSAHVVNEASETTAEIRFAAQMIARDLANLYRDPDAENVRLIGASQGLETGGPPFLTFYTVGRAKARADQPEGDVYEVEYFLGTHQGEREDEATGLEEEAMVLFRRLWPNPDRERIPAGILAPIAENVGVFHIRFFDGEEWASEWPEEMRSLPQLIEVSLATLPPEKGDPVAETFTVTFPRMGSMAAGRSQESEPSESGQSSGSPATESTSESESTPSGNQNNSGNVKSR